MSVQGSFSMPQAVRYWATAATRGVMLPSRSPNWISPGDLKISVRPDRLASIPMATLHSPCPAGEAVEEAEDDGVRPPKGPDLPDGLVQGGGVHRHQDQVHRLAVRRVAVGKAAFFPVAEGGLGGIPGRPRFVRDHLHPGHL